MGFDELTPRQLASSVGKNSVGVIVSPVPSEDGSSPITSANNNSPTKAAYDNSLTHPQKSSLPNSPAKSTSVPLKHFAPHSPEVQETFASLDSGLDLTIGKFYFFVNKFGT